MGLYEIGKVYRAKRNENLVVLFWAVVLILLMSLSQAHCQEYKYVDAKDLPIEVATPTPGDNYNPGKAMAIGLGMVLAPIPFVNKDLPWGHSVELEGFSFMETYGWKRLLPKELDWAAPVLTSLLNVGYRLTQPDTPMRWQKLAVDELGVLHFVLFDYKF